MAERQYKKGGPPGTAGRKLKLELQRVGELLELILDRVRWRILIVFQFLCDRVADLSLNPSNETTSSAS